MATRQGPSSPQDYFDAGMDLLAAEGVSALTIARLCAALGVTKGSFYHHFRGVEDYRTQLLTHWASDRSAQVVAAAGAIDDPVRRLRVLLQAGVDLPHEAEAAIRAWSQRDPDAWRVRVAVDEARERTIAEAFRAAGVDTARAELYGRLAVVTLVGAQHRGAVTDRASLRAMFDWMLASALAQVDGGPAPRPRRFGGSDGSTART
jgi:AcrR family transcriptional regulator